MTRAEHEDAILALLRAAIPQNIKVESVPRGLDDPKARDVRDGAVWVVYVGGRKRPSNNALSKVHVEDWTWSVFVLAKTYRSAEQGASEALALLEQVNAALSGAKIQGRMLTRQGDQLLPMPDESKLIGYEAQFSINVFAPRAGA